MEDDSSPAVPARPNPPALRGGLILCENCGKETLHRIVKVADPRSRRIEGVARCNDCRWTHPFSIPRPELRTIRQIISHGARSEATSLRLPSTERLEVGHRVPGSTPAMRVLRIDTRTGHRVSSEIVDQTSAIWVTPDEGAAVPVSIVEGRRTRPARIVVPPQTVLTVGAEIRVEGDRLFIAALRARGRTWRRDDDGFEAREVQRIYARRTSIPPAGRSDWSRDRGMSSSRASATSRSSRSRSSPGVSRNRTFPRARTAGGGATVHSAAP
jgi:uncharacterized Zn finger protein